MHDLDHGIGVAFICLMFFVVVYLKNVPVLSRGPLNFLGRISYPLYLGHAMVGYMLLDLFYPVTGQWGSRIIALVLVICFAYRCIFPLKLRFLHPSVLSSLES